MTIAVHESYRRQGVASKLLEACAELFGPAGRKPCRHLELHCLTTNRAAIALYKKCGFRIARTIRDHYYIDQQFHDAYLLRYERYDSSVETSLVDRRTNNSTTSLRSRFFESIRGWIEGTQKFLLRTKRISEEAEAPSKASFMRV